jgi:hypothetical protein
MNPIYQFVLSSRGICGSASLNGMPLAVLDADGECMHTKALNPFLVGAGNLLRIEVKQRNANAELDAGIKVAQQGEMIDLPGNREITLAPGPAPVAIEHRFDTEISPFVSVLEAARVSNAAEMVAFALKLRDQFKARDMAALATCFKPKARLFASAFGVPEAALQADLSNALREFTGADLSFESRDIEAVPHCDKRIWELRNRGRELLRKSSDSGESTLQVFAVAMAEGLVVIA